MVSASIVSAYAFGAFDEVSAAPLYPSETRFSLSTAPTSASAYRPYHHERQARREAEAPD